MNDQVHVYWNIHRKVWSVRCARTRRVVAHCADVTLSGVTFYVSEAGRQRVLREGVKNVHAWAVGTLCAHTAAREGEPARVRYNPRTGPRFVTRDTGDVVAAAAVVRFDPDRSVYAWSAAVEPSPASPR